MPYIRQEDRMRAAKLPETPGELNYAITMMIMEYVDHIALPSYSAYNTAIGVLECVKLEFARRVLNPYEDLRCKENGDVY